MLSENRIWGNINRWLGNSSSDFIKLILMLGNRRSSWVNILKSSKSSNQISRVSTIKLQKLKIYTKQTCSSDQYDD